MSIELDAKTPAEGPVQPDGRGTVVLAGVVQIGVGAKAAFFYSNGFAALAPPAGWKCRVVGIGFEIFHKKHLLDPAASG